MRSPSNFNRRTLVMQASKSNFATKFFSDNVQDILEHIYTPPGADLMKNKGGGIFKDIPDVLSSSFENSKIHIDKM